MLVRIERLDVNVYIHVHPVCRIPRYLGTYIMEGELGCLESGELEPTLGSSSISRGQGFASHLQNILPGEWSHSGKTCRPDQPIHVPSDSSLGYNLSIPIRLGQLQTLHTSSYISRLLLYHTVTQKTKMKRKAETQAQPKKAPVKRSKSRSRTIRIQLLGGTND